MPFWNKTYPLLGFDSYIGVQDLENPYYSGSYVSDTELNKLIIDEFESTDTDTLREGSGKASWVIGFSATFAIEFVTP